MGRKIVLTGFIFAVIAWAGGFSLAQEAGNKGADTKTAENKETAAKAAEAVKDEIIKGTIKEIAEDSTYIIVDDTKIATTKELIDDAYFEVGDKVEITVEKTGAGLKAVNYNYVFEDENMTEEGMGASEE